MPTDEINRRARLMLGRNIDSDELKNLLILSTPEQHIAAIEHVGSELERPDISLRERARLLNLKMEMNSILQHRLRVYR